jgi:hypothetical protein
MPVREKGQARRFAAATSLSHVPSHRRPPPKCGAFRRQPRGSLLRRTHRWREGDSNPRSPSTVSSMHSRAYDAAPRRHREARNARSFASTSSASDLRHAWGAFTWTNRSSISAWATSIAAKGFDGEDPILRAAIREQVGSTIERLHRAHAIENNAAERASKWELAGAQPILVRNIASGRGSNDQRFDRPLLRFLSAAGVSRSLGTVVGGTSTRTQGSPSTRRISLSRCKSTDACSVADGAPVSLDPLVCLLVDFMLPIP